MNSKDIGKKIKSVRSKKKMTQQVLADLAGITKSHISKIENGLTTPTLVTLSNIAKALDSPTSWFIEQEEHGELSIVRKDKREAIDEKNEIGYEYELLANKKNMSIISPTIVTVLPGAENIEPYIHENDEFIFILTGSIHLLYDGTKYEMTAGDSAYFSGKKPHIFLSNSKSHTTVLTVYVENQ
ncbi:MULTISPECIES: helix-turn-helix domain-containing protein [Psychrobacillus]|uniref:Helix-turn-helix domain-containing protein n=1 Tax=Psychrobacillus faecigallinarum TaxID=2762235 RepID=A0ABR8RDH2_9BACI|nr:MULTISPECIES: helix-turn-helix domain-containing protein [Psychrobacillus]MBD7945859.1 helix-turn-helix domain-containing protein [Psychrobacillus faecigallinarum]QEY22177.1 helix-turn-helix domain-containing protein [Psychrobacillus sp. AK 1817]QGM29058.1 helix-turn-helix domain-containing protein [Bacillus sp. N3536]